MRHYGQQRKAALLWSDAPADGLLVVEAKYRIVTLGLVKDGQFARLSTDSAALLRDIHADLDGRDNPVPVSAQQLDLRPQIEFRAGEPDAKPNEAVLHGQMMLCGTLFHVLAVEVYAEGGPLIAVNESYQPRVDDQYGFGGIPATTRINNRTYLLVVAPQATP